MGRRQWIKLNGFFSGSMVLMPSEFRKNIKEKARDIKGRIKEDYLLNLSYTAFEYTDLPSSTWDFHVGGENSMDANI